MKKNMQRLLSLREGLATMMVAVDDMLSDYYRSTEAVAAPGEGGAYEQTD